MNIPKLRQQKTTKKCHGVSWEDNYAWIHQENILEVLKDPTKLNSEVRQYLEKNNEYTEHHLKDTKEFQKKLFNEIKGRIKLDDKTLPYIRISNEPYPRVEIIRQKNLTKDDHNYFGPYTDAGYLREILRVIHKIFTLRTCTYFIDENTIQEGKIKICLDYHIKRCEGPCEGLVSLKEYGNMIDQIKRFLKGPHHGP